MIGERSSCLLLSSMSLLSSLVSDIRLIDSWFTVGHIIYYYYYGGSKHQKTHRLFKYLNLNSLDRWFFKNCNPLVPDEDFHPRQLNSLSDGSSIKVYSNMFLYASMMNRFHLPVLSWYCVAESNSFVSGSNCGLSIPIRRSPSASNFLTNCPPPVLYNSA